MKNLTTCHDRESNEYISLYILIDAMKLRPNEGWTADRDRVEVGTPLLPLVTIAKPIESKEVALAQPPALSSHCETKTCPQRYINKKKIKNENKININYYLELNDDILHAFTEYGMLQNTAKILSCKKKTY